MTAPFGRPPRDLHPGAWWAWAVGLAALASRSIDARVLATALLVAAIVVRARRGTHPRAGAFGLALRLGAVVLAVRVAAQVVLGVTVPGRVLVTLPALGLPGWLAGIRLGGAVTDAALALALVDGLRIATVLAIVGAAHALADPRRLLAAMPPALHGVGVALVVALTFVPSLTTAVGRVRAARRLRGRPDRGPRGALTIVLPVLDDALDRALALAAAMDARGYGRGHRTSARARALVAMGLAALAIGLVAVLDGGGDGPLAIAVVASGMTAALVGLARARDGVLRTRYRPDPWRAAEWMTVASGVTAALLALTLPPAALAAAALVGLVPLVATPPPAGRALAVAT